jgi:hypothetical protein
VTGSHPGHPPVDSFLFVIHEFRPQFEVSGYFRTLLIKLGDGMC